MNSPKSVSSPTYKNVKLTPRHSPVELKEKMRKNYKSKVQNCRNALLSRLRGTEIESSLRDTLTEIYRSMFPFSYDQAVDEEENIILETIKEELVQEELEWWLAEYDNAQMVNIDWSLIENDNNVICPICQKTNLVLEDEILKCAICAYAIHTKRNISDIKCSITGCVDTHSSGCPKEAQFSIISDNDPHIYLVCSTCNEIQMVI